MSNINTSQLTREELEKMVQEMNNSIHEAQQSDEPFLTNHNKGDYQVIGNPNNTEENEQIYTLSFAVPLSENSVIPKEYLKTSNDGKYVHFEKTYVNPTIKAYRRIKMIGEAIEVIKFFSTIAEDEQSLRDMEPEELFNIFTNIDEQLILNVYRFVGAFLEEDKELMAYAKPLDLFFIAGKIIMQNSDLIKEADNFLTSTGIDKKMSQ